MKYIPIINKDDYVYLDINKTNNNKPNKKSHIKIINKILEENFKLYIYFIIISFVLILIIFELFIISEVKSYNDILQRIIQFNNLKNTTNNITIINNINDTFKEKEEKNETENEKKNYDNNYTTEKKEEKSIIKKEDIYKEEKFSSRDESYNKAKSFLDNNSKGVLIHKIPSKMVENPKVSAVIPVYNSKNLISRAIKSIQNQNISDIEIVLVNDFSTDDTLSFIEKIQKEDPRIKIIKNKKNMGILYSRCIGVLSAKGKYIFPLDNDDMFLDEDVFDIVSKIADKGDFDIVEFKAITTFNYKSGIYKNRRVDSAFSGHPLNLVLYQPELGRFSLQEILWINII